MLHCPYSIALGAETRPDFTELVREPVPEAAVKKDSSSGGWVLRSDEQVVLVSKAEKMSKSKGNVVNPDSVRL